MSSPCSEGGRLQGSAKGERQDPGFREGTVVDGVQVNRGFLFALTAREESNSCGGADELMLLCFFINHTIHLPATAGGTVRRMAVTVAIATSSGLYLVGQLCPAVTMFGLRRVPSKYTWWSDMALYTAART